MYADDILLLANSVTDLQLMLNLCSATFLELDLPINVEKSHCLRVGPRCKFACLPLELSGSSIKWTSNTKYLGITLRNNDKFSCCRKEVKSKFYCSVNTIFGRIGSTAPENVLLKLIESQALPILTYGTCAATLSVSDLRSLSYTYDSAFAKKFDNQHCYN